MVTMATLRLTNDPFQCLSVTKLWHASELILNQCCLEGHYTKTHGQGPHTTGSYKVAIENKGTWGHNTPAGQVFRWWELFNRLCASGLPLAAQCTVDSQSLIQSWAATRAGTSQWWTLLKSLRRGRRRPLPPGRRQRWKPMERRIKTQRTRKKPTAPAERRLRTSSSAILQVRKMVNELQLKYFFLLWHFLSQYAWRKCFPIWFISSLCPFILFSLLSIEQGHSTSL